MTNTEVVKAFSKDFWKMAIIYIFVKENFHSNHFLRTAVFEHCGFWVLLFFSTVVLEDCRFWDCGFWVLWFLSTADSEYDLYDQPCLRKRLIDKPEFWLVDSKAIDQHKNSKNAHCVSDPDLLKIFSMVLQDIKLKLAGKAAKKILSL